MDRRFSLLPRSLFGQTLLAIVAALLIAQAVSAVFLFRATEQRRELTALNAAAFHLAVGELRMRRSDLPRRFQREFARPGLVEPRRGVIPRRLRFTYADENPLLPGEVSDADRAEILSNILAARGIETTNIVVVERAPEADPVLRPVLERRALRAAQASIELAKPPSVLVAAVQRDGGPGWSVARVGIPPLDRRIVRGLFFQVLVTFALLLVPLILILRRITRPIARLTDQTRAFAGTDKPDRLKPEGPADVRRLIAAHNAMEERISTMLEEKDVMLGAIGHDLKTPLAALRVRVESVADAKQRERMIATIADINAKLDDILDLTRAARPSVQAEPTDLVALARKVVARHRELDQPVTLEHADAATLSVQARWIDRALSNLISNAVRYGKAGRVSVLAKAGAITLRVDDDGPGIPQERIAGLVEPFARGETSRNRATGGSGLGLAIARTVAQQHGGELILTNRDEGGLRAEIRLPA